MHLYRFRRVVLVLAGLLPGIAAAAAERSRPNIVLIVADDLGYGDLGCYDPACKVPSPRVDGLAAAGMRFTDAHSGSAVCTPTRYGLLTGRYAWRTRLQQGVFYGYEEPLIAADRPTAGSLLQRHGYHTACIGKWHLGWQWPRPVPAADPDFSRPIGGGPITRGFHTYFGTHVPNQPPYVFIHDDRTVGLPTARKPTADLSGIVGPMLPDWTFEEILPTLAERAVRHIDERAAAKEPFFLYLALTTPHEPITPSPRFRGRSSINAVADLMLETDWAVGEILAALSRNQIADNTLVIFTSDNGHATYTGLQPLLDRGHRPSGPLKGYKGDIHEGGHRVPFIVCWPGVVPPGTRCDETICHTHFLATVADILGESLDDAAGEDSASILPLLRRDPTAKTPFEAVVHHAANGRFAIRKGPWKLVFPQPFAASKARPAGAESEAEIAARGAVELYDLSRDLGESENVAARNPAVVSRLAAVMERFVANGRSRPGKPAANDVAVDVWKGSRGGERPPSSGGDDASRH